MLIDFGGPPKALLLDRIFHAAMKALPNLPASQQVLVELFGPQANWPNDCRLRGLIDQAWSVCEFEHDGSRASIYQRRSEISPHAGSLPQAWYSLTAPLAAIFGDRTDCWFSMMSTSPSTISSRQSYSKRTRPMRDQSMSLHGLAQVPCWFRAASFHPFALRTVDRCETEIRFEA